MIYVTSSYSNCQDKHQLMRHLNKAIAHFVATRPLQTYVSPLYMHYVCIEDPSVGTDYKFWEQCCREILRKCDSMIVVKFPGWEASTGVKAEIQDAIQNGIQIEYFDPTVLGAM